jgi:hypothetical protein
MLKLYKGSRGAAHLLFWPLVGLVVGCGAVSHEFDVVLALPIQIDPQKPALMMKLRGKDTLEDVRSFAKLHGVMHAEGQLIAAAQPRIEATLKWLQQPVVLRAPIVVAKRPKITVALRQGGSVLELSQAACEHHFGGQGHIAEVQLQMARHVLSTHTGESEAAVAGALAKLLVRDRDDVATLQRLAQHGFGKGRYAETRALCQARSISPVTSEP